MRAFLTACALPLIVATSAAAQQRTDTLPDTRGLPREVAREVIDVYNAAGTLRASGSLTVAAERDILGDLAVLNGPLTIAGHVGGRVVAVNADVVLKPGARIDGDLLVVGGVVEGKDVAQVGGDIRVYRQVLYYREEDDHIVADRRGDEEDAGWWRRERRTHSHGWSDLRIASAHTYNRVEGLPIYIGPRLGQRTAWGRFTLDAFGIVRTGNNFDWNTGTLGHSVRSEVRFGDRTGIAFGGRLYDVVDTPESWGLTDTEVGLASFFLHRDYRDYYGRHGGEASVALLAGEDADLSLSFADERWAARGERDPWTLFRNQQPWRPNPLMDEGIFHLAVARLHVDTRNDEHNPWSGWYVLAELEHGEGMMTSFGATSPGTRAVPFSGVGDVSYERGFLDLRRYNRLSPDAQLNFRVVAGGWLGGDPLPLERRLSVGGPGSLPGFDFRALGNGADVGTCSPDPATAPPGNPAQCDRIAMAQAEYRGDLHIRFFDTEDDDSDWWPRPHVDGDLTWVVFADAGRGWMVGDQPGPLWYARSAVPPLNTFRTDLGVGVDFGDVGAYVAKAVSQSGEPPNFFVRVRKRF